MDKIDPTKLQKKGSKNSSLRLPKKHKTIAQKKRGKSPSLINNLFF